MPVELQIIKRELHTVILEDTQYSAWVENQRAGLPADAGEESIVAVATWLERGQWRQQEALAELCTEGNWTDTRETELEDIVAT